MGTVEKNHLAQQGLDPDSVPPKDQQVFLRSNSNVSTGGDSFDCTDDISDVYKALALRSAKAVRAYICGVDIIITDTHAAPAKEYAVILEVNFNPAIYMHECPYAGKARPVTDHLLDLLGF